MTDRICTPDMKPFERFQFGDAVAHISMGDGRVIGNDGSEVRVQYDRGGIGKYDANWFQRNPRFLFHRNVTALTPMASDDRISTTHR